MHALPAYDEVDELCVAGNYFPAWTSAVNTYAVAGSWLDKPFKAYKLSLDRYDEYVHLCRTFDMHADPLTKVVARDAFIVFRKLGANHA